MDTKKFTSFEELLNASEFIGLMDAYREGFGASPFCEAFVHRDEEYSQVGYDSLGCADFREALSRYDSGILLRNGLRISKDTGWEVFWPEEKLIELFQMAMQTDQHRSLLTLWSLMGQVAGFVLSIVSDVDHILSYIRFAAGDYHSAKMYEAVNNLGLSGDSQVLYLDAAVANPHIASSVQRPVILARLAKMHVINGIENDAVATLVWSTPQSLMVPMLLSIGFEILVDGHCDPGRTVPVIVLGTSDILSLLEALSDSPADMVRRAIRQLKGK